MRTLTAFTAGLVLFAMLTVAAAGGHAAPAAPSPNAVRPGSPCLPPSSTSPSSVLIPTREPTGTLASGSAISATYEVRIVNPPAHFRTAAIYVPAMYASFYGGSTAKIQLYFPPGWVTLSGGSWTAPVTVSKPLSGAFTFSAGNATLSSVWLAIMSNATFGSWAAQFQWHWTEVPTHGHPVNGPWSSPTRASTVHVQPSTLYPAPYVHVVNSTSTKSAPSGSNFTANLSGNVSGTSFRMVVETGTGHEVNSVCLTSPNGTTSFAASIPLTYSNGTTLPPATYGIHVHNAGGAIVVFLRVTVT